MKRQIAAFWAVHLLCAFSLTVMAQSENQNSTALEEAAKLNAQVINLFLAVPSREAAMKWRFAPTKHDGKAVKVRGILTFHFTLQ